MTHMLVASDLTSKSIYPLDRAMQLREQSGALVTVLHVVEPGFTSYLEERRRLDALTVLQEWRAALPEAERQGVTVNVMVGDPFATIIEEAASRQMDLVVVGHPSKSGLRDLFLGTTAERVVRFGDHPVLMVNQPANGGYKRVLVAMDFSQAGRLALEWACHIAPDAEVRIVHAWQSPLINFSRNDDAGLATANERLRLQEEQQLKALVAQMGLPGKPPRIEIIERSPQTAIRIGIGAFDAQLLAMGTHSRSRRRTVMVGSLAQEFLAEGACDVLVARG